MTEEERSSKTMKMKNICLSFPVPPVPEGQCSQRFAQTPPEVRKTVSATRFPARGSRKGRLPAPGAVQRLIDGRTRSWNTFFNGNYYGTP